MDGYYNTRAFNDVFTFLGSGGTLCPTLRVDCNPLPELVVEGARRIPQGRRTKMHGDIGSDLLAGVLRPRELLCNGRVWVCGGASSNVDLELEWCDKWNKVQAYDPKEGYTLSLGDVVPTGTLDAMIFIQMKYGASVRVRVRRFLRLHP
jgi:hypothetical protein